MCFGDADKIATKETIKLVEKIIDVKKEEFLKNQKILSEFMNKGYELISKNDFECSSMGMGIGSSGCGKSTTLNLMHGNDFVTKKDIGDVTMQLSEPILIDCVGFTPSLASFCKLILIFFQRGFFPNYFLYPSSNDRTEQIVTLYRMVRMDYVKIMVVPFSAKNYHSNIELIKEINPTISESEVDKIALKKAFNGDMVSHIIKKLAEIKSIIGKVVVVDSLERVPEVIGSMKTKFLNEFFISVDAMKNLSSFAIYDKDGVLIGINELKFLKDN
ncbi:hypothetical protein ACTFIR_006696 [Dictyostelium discoideum]